MSGTPAGPRLTLGVVGHVDHGKTALVRALTGMETDRLPEEQARGVSIVLGFAHARFGGAEVDFIDAPGHERFVRAMISGATGVDAALLVVAANEGVKPQTVEHLEIASLLGLARVLPVIAKADLVGPADAARITDAVLAQVRAVGLEPEPPELVSVHSGLGLQGLRAAIARLAGDVRGREDDGFAWLPIDRAFTVAGRGTVVTGTLRRGRLAQSDALTLTPHGGGGGGGEVRVRGLQVHGEAVAAAEPGQRVAVNLRGVEPAQAPRGAALASPGALAPSDWLSVQLRTVASAPRLRTGRELALLFGATEVGARLRLLDRDVLEPGETALGQLHLARPEAAPARERFVLRLPSPAATVGGGRVLDPAAGRLRRRDPAVLARLDALARATPAEVLQLTLAEAGAKGAPLDRLAALAGLSPARARAELNGCAQRFAGELFLGRAPALDLAKAVLATLQAQAELQPNGLARRRLAALLPQASAGALDGVIAALAAAGRLSAEGGSVRLAPRRADEAARVAREAALAAELGRRLRSAGLAPPDLAELAPTPAARQALEVVLKGGEGVRTFDRVQKRELVFHREAVADARARLAPHLAPPGLTVGEAGAVLGMTRKFSVPLLEYLDTVRFTRRQGDRRVLGPDAQG